jgi:ribose transport system substrate-binding protein
MSTIQIQRGRAIIVGLLCLILGLAAGTAFQTWRGQPQVKPDRQRVYALNAAISAMAFWNEPRQTWERIGSVTPGLRTIFGGPSDSDPAKQIEQVDNLLSQHVDGLVVFSTDPNALVPTVNRAVEMGIPVVTVFADLPGSKRLAYVGANQVASAKAIASRTLQDFPDRVKPDSKVLIAVGKIGAEDQDARRKGFEEEVGGRMKLATPVVDDYSPEKATEAIRAALVRDPDIKFIFGCDSQSAVGAIAALKELGKKPGDVIVTGWDSEEVVVKEIKASTAGVGWVHATAVLYSRYMVETAFSILEAAHFRYLASSSAAGGSGAFEVPKMVEIPIRIVTAENVDDFLSGQEVANQPGKAR